MRSIWKKSAPSTVRLEDVREELEAAREGTAILGMGETGPMTLDLDYSHVMVVGGTGSGKSVLVRSVLAQQLAHGADVLILDQAWGGHRWAKGHPDVTHAPDIDTVHYELVRLGEELADRLVAGYSEVQKMRRIVVALEHRGSLVEALRRFWEIARVPGLSPEGSPAVAALAALEWASPLLRINLVASSQTAAPLSPFTREVYGVRIASASVSPQAWQQIAGDLPRPVASTGAPRRRGRFCVVTGMAAGPLNGLCLTPLESQFLVAAVIAAGRGEWGAA
ncbi:MAG: helicase HerA domain-containing protein [Pseudonocardiaceae bacterium]